MKTIQWSPQEYGCWRISIESDDGVAVAIELAPWTVDAMAHAFALGRLPTSEEIKTRQREFAAREAAKGTEVMTFHPNGDAHVTASSRPI